MYKHQNTVIFESISDIPEWIEAHPQLADDGSTSTGPSKSWDLGVGLDGAMEMAADGGYWPEGAERMIEATTKAAELKRDGFAPEIDFDVAGAYLEMDEYLDGSPECFYTVNDEVPVSVIKIGVQQYTPAMNSFEEFLNRGAALLSVIDDIEAKGVRVELWGCVSGISRLDSKLPEEERTGIDMRTCLKAAEDGWSPSSVAFGLCHAAFGRRLGFRVAESFENNSRYCGSHCLNYDQDRPMGSDFDVWFGYRNMIDNNYSSVKHALERVTAEVEKQLKDGSNHAAV